MFLHHQKRLRIGNDIYINIGEDGYPYADNKLLIVADGLGGRGGYPHTKINPDVLDSEIFYEKFISPVLCNGDEEYIRFVKASFSELFQLRDKYFTNRKFMRTSGYFASRLVTAIVLHTLKFDPDFSHEIIFDNMDKLEQEMKEQYINGIAHKLAEIIQTKLFQLANLMGLELESKSSGSYLLPTTLVVTMINETKTGTDVLYLWAGDSRGYIWDNDGLAQISDDHEKDETITNLISLTKPIKIESRYINLSKSTIIFNATDGCYKCYSFASPFDLEYVLLGAIEVSCNWEEISKNLDEVFAKIGAHDDSNTIALTTVGYGSFDEIKLAVEERMNFLKEHIIKELPDILERNYDDELYSIEEQLATEIDAQTDNILRVEGIAEKVKQTMLNEGYTPYKRELSTLQEKVEYLNVEKQIQEELISKWASYYWLRKPSLKKIVKTRKNLNFGHIYERVYRMEKALIEEELQQREKYKRDLEQLNKNITDINNSINSLIGANGQFGLAQKTNDMASTEKFLDNIETVESILNYFKNNLVNGKTQRSQYVKISDKINRITQYYVKKDIAQIEELTKQISEKKVDILAVDMPKKCKNKIKSYLERLEIIESEKAKTMSTIDDLIEKSIWAYWRMNLIGSSLRIYEEYIEKNSIAIGQDVRGKIGHLISMRNNILHGLETRQKLYANYEKSYYRLFKESRI